MVIKQTPTHHGFFTVFHNPAFKCAFITSSPQYAFGKIREMKRHNDSDEIFVLLAGTAVLLTKDETNAPYDILALESLTAYNVAKGTWHYLAVSEDAIVFVAESGSMEKQNTETLNIESSDIYLKLEEN